MYFRRSVVAVVATNSRCCIVRNQQLLNPTCHVLPLAVIRGSDRCCLRWVSTSPGLFEKPSSKIEETVQHLQEEEKPEKLPDEADPKLTKPVAAEPAPKPAKPIEPGVNRYKNVIPRH
jgi:hypothetical protein